MTTLLQADRTWNATPTPVGSGTWTVIASAPDPAGNVGSATQTLAVDPGAAGATGGTGPTLTPVTPALVTPTPSTPTPSPVTPTHPLTPAPDRRSTFNAVATTTVTRNTSQAMKGSTLSIGTRVTAPAGGRIVATASGTVKIAGIAGAITLSTTTTALGAGRSTTLNLIPKGTRNATKAAVRKLTAAAGTGKKVIATITIKIADAVGHTRIVTRTVTLT